MLKEKEHCKQCQIRQGVLILILMEHAQRAEDQVNCSVVASNIVLILILMEHAQREYFL